MRTINPAHAGYKGLPTFRAGGVTSRTDYYQIQGGNGHKSALKPTFYSRDHFSSPLADVEDPMMKLTRVSVKLLEGRNLLVSDLLTGTSDPMALLWVGASEEGEVTVKHDKRVQSAKVCRHTVDPVWDAEFVFPLEVKTIEDVMSGCVNVLVRDYDDADGDIHYVDLGRISIPLETVLVEGNIMAHTQLVQLPARWYPLQRCRGLKTTQGALKIAVGFFVGPESMLLRDEDGISEQDVESSVRFEQRILSLRGNDGPSGRGRTVSLSPTRGISTPSRELTKRGGTTSVRPKSAPEATTLISHSRLSQRPFELKSIQPRNPTARRPAEETAAITQDWRETQTSSTWEAEAIPAPEVRARWQNSYGSSKGRPNDTNTIPFTTDSERVAPSQRLETPRDEYHTSGLLAESPPTAATVRPSQRLARITAKAKNLPIREDNRPNASFGWDKTEGPTVRAYRWKVTMLESMQRLEGRSTEGAAYGELRAMVREATSTQVSQIVIAARGVGAACSLSARRYTLRLLAWLCWEQQQAASACHAGIVSYLLDRIRDDETASLHSDLTACVGAVMLSALRYATADACMVQTRRFLHLVGEQKMSVRESAGVCCVASVLPPPPRVPVEVETGLGCIDDVRLAIGRAAERGRIANPIPKEAVLLPGGRAVIELADAEAAASCLDRMSVTAKDLPSTWRINPFPKDFCTRVHLAQAAHHARLTVNSEDVLASLLEALGSGRTVGTRGQLFDAIAALAHSFAAHEDGVLKLPEAGMTTSVAGTRCGLRGIAITLKKGLPVIARVVLEVLNCPMRRAHTWKERKAALKVITALAILTDLRGVEGPIGEHRTKFIQGVTRVKHDSVAGVREAARESLAALEGTEVEQEKRKSGQSLSTLAGAGIRGWSGSGARKSAEAVMKSKRAARRETWKAAGSRTTLDAVVMKAGKVKVSAKASREQAEPPQPSHEAGVQCRLFPQEEVNAQTSQNQEAAGPKPPISGAGSSSSFTEESVQEDPPPCAQVKSLSSLRLEQTIEDRGTSPQYDAAEQPRPTPRTSPRISGRVDSTHAATITSTSPERKRKQGKEGSATQQTRLESTKPAHKEDDDEWQPANPEGKPAHSDALPAPARQPTPTAHQTTVQVVPVSLQTKAPQETANTPQPLENEAGGNGAATSCLSLASLHDANQVNTVRLLNHLRSKTERIASVLDGLNQRILGIAKSLAERPYTADEPLFLPLRRKLKRPRSNQTKGPDKAARISDKGKPFNSESKRNRITDADTACRVAQKCSDSRTSRLTREIKVLIARDDIESAFRVALSFGTERDILRLMARAGGPDLCRHRLGMNTRDLLFAFLARTISAGQYVEHALPWVFEVVRAGEAGRLALAVRMQLAGALHGLAASPTCQGVMAARLGPYLSLTSVGQRSMSDATEGGAVFSSMGVEAGM